MNEQTAANTPSGNPPSSSQPSSDAVIPEEIFARLEGNHSLPTLDRSATVRGVDANNNGIRDDVESYIETHFSGNQAQREAALQFAAAVQAQIEANIDDVNAVQAVLNQTARSMACLTARFDATGDDVADTVVSDIRAISANTYERMVSYLVFSSAADGAVISLFDEGVGCDVGGGVPAENDDLPEDEVVFGFFNGSQNDVNKAVTSLYKLRTLYGTTVVQGSKTVPVRYDLFYNKQSGGALALWDMADASSADSIAQVENDLYAVRRAFLEGTPASGSRAQQTVVDSLFQGRYEYLFSLLEEGDGHPATWRQMVEGEAGMSTAFQGRLEAAKARYRQMMRTELLEANRKLLADDQAIAQGTATPWADHPQHRARIETHALMGRKLLLVAHSQGNMFVNRAYDYAIQNPVYDASTVKVIHIAPAAYRLAYDNAPAVLADKDTVINPTGVFDYVPGSWALKRVDIASLHPEIAAQGRGQVVIVPIPDEDARNYIMWSTDGDRPEDPKYFYSTDALGHGLFEIYLNPYLPIVVDAGTRIDQTIMDEVVESIMEDSLTELIAVPRIQPRASMGFFTAMLTWDGSGDADLHVFEPTGKQVFYRQKQGDSGYLDVDNTQGYGPEHYYATLNNAGLLRGIYDIGVHNYWQATGRTATITIMGTQGQVLATKSVVLPDAGQTIPIRSNVNMLFGVEIVDSTTRFDADGNPRLELIVH